MNQTFVEKALARAARLEHVVPGQVIDVFPDLILSHDNSAAIAKIFTTIGVRQIKEPDKVAIALDHAVPAPTTKHAQNHAEIRKFVAQQKIKNFFEVGRGICHQVLSEEALILPGQTLLGADSHSTHYGWLGAFGAGVGRSEVAALWATGKIWLRVPESIHIVLDSPLPHEVTSKDFALRILKDLGADGGLYSAVEFSGPGITALSLDSRMVLANMMAEMGVKNAYLQPDKKVYQWLADRLATRRNTTSAVCFEEIQRQALFPDSKAVYTQELHYQGKALETYIARPHAVDDVVPLSTVAGISVDQAFLGTCTNGRLEDIALAAKIMEGNHVAASTRFLVIPASNQIYQAAMQRGYLQILMAAGAVIGVPGCGPCMGNHMGIPAPGEVVISSANRNFQGRMGTREAEIYLANPAVVAASAITGKITAPRRGLISSDDSALIQAS